MRHTIIITVWAVAIPAAASGAIMGLWNGIMPQLFGLASIGFWQALGLFLLSQLLTGGFVFGLFLLAAGLHTIGHHHNSAAHEQWMRMTDEQRAELIRRRMSGFGYWKQGTEADSRENAEQKNHANG